MITQAEVNIMIMQAVRAERDRRLLAAIYERYEATQRVIRYINEQRRVTK